MFFGRKAKNDKRLLKIDILEAEGLLGATNKGKSSDARVRLKVKDLGGRAVDKETVSTKVVKNTLNPTWNEQFEIGRHYQMDTEDLPDVELQIFHRSMLTSEVPLGQVTVNLMPVDPSGRDFMEVWLDLEKSGRMKTVSGRIRVRLQFNKSPSHLDDDFENSTVDNEGMSRESMDMRELNRDSANREKALTYGFHQEDSVQEGEPPNQMNIMVIRARNLIGVDKPLLGGAGTSDPFVKVRVYGRKEGDSYPKVDTKVKHKDLNPVWMERFVIPLRAEEATLQFKVYDKNNAAFNKFLGSAIIPAAEFLDKKLHKKWYKLYNEFGNADGVDRGDLELAMQWNVSSEQLLKDNENASKEKSVGGRLLGKFFGKSYEESEPEDEDDVSIDEFAFEDEDGPVMSDEDREKAQEEAKKQQEALESIEIKDGDWQLQVHVIEARDLKGENFDGTSDPIVYVEAFGQKQHSQVVFGQTSCVFDEVLIFNMKGLTKDEFNTSVIRISVMDFNTLKNTMIGAYSFDAASVYTSNKHHEMYRAWVGLIDDVDSDDIGVQGYLKLSVSLIGPGEKVYIHDLDAELQEEIKKENACGGDLSQLILSVPVVRKEWNYVVAKVFKAEDLPIMDGKLAMLSSAGTDAFCKLAFGGAKPVKTKVKTIKSESRRAMQPVFNYELWYPVSIPTMCSLAKFSVWDHDEKGSEIIGQLNASIKEIRAHKHSNLPTRWFNLYGSHEFKQDSLGNNIKKIGGEVKKLAKRVGGIEIDWYKFYNDVPTLAPCYKGRVLVNFRMEKDRPLKYQEDEIEPFRRKIKGLPYELFPETAEYKLKVMVVSGTELPAFSSISGLTSGNVTKMMSYQPLKIKVQIGIEELCTAEAKFEKGVCRWNELMESPTIKLPKDLSQVPDIFIYLISEAGRPVSFQRLPASKVLQRGYGGDKDVLDTIGFDSRAEWIYLKEDKALDCLDAGEFPGSVLIKLGFGSLADCRECRKEWETCLADATRFTNYQCRVHLFQARDIPPADSNGLSDPFVSVNFLGHQKCTKIVKGTLFPTWYDTLVFSDVSIASANNFEYSPKVNFRVFDHDGPGIPKLDLGKAGAKLGEMKDKFKDKTGVKLPGGRSGRPSKPGLMDEYIGMAQSPLSDAILADYDADVREFPDPIWQKMFMEEPGDGRGSILVLVQLIESNGREIPKELPKPIPPELSIIPPSRQAWIEMIIMGVRNLAPYHFRSMTSPFLEMTLESLGNKYTTETEPSKVPSPDNPNFLQRMVLPVRMPENSIFATPLAVVVKDRRLGGFLKPIVGTGAIDLTTKIPWCEDTYVAPATQVFMEQSIEQQQMMQAVQEAEEHVEERGEDLDELITRFERDHRDPVSGMIVTHEDDEFELIEVDTDEEVDSDDDDFEEAKERMIAESQAKLDSLDPEHDDDTRAALLKRQMEGVPTRRVKKKKLIRKKFDEIARKVRDIREKRKQNLLADDYIVNPEPPEIEDVLKERQGDEDTGAGVFGALQHIKVKGISKAEAEAAAFTDPDWTQDDGDLPPDWSIGRSKLEGGIEEELVTSPFETYDLVRGKEGVKGRAFGHTKKVVGKFKGLIRIMLSEDQEPMFNEEMMEQLLKPKPYTVRLYLLRATNLVGMDLDMYGNIAKSDPYVKVKLGKFKFSDRENAQDDMTDVDLYKLVEIDCELPGASQLVIDMMDKDHIGSDDLIGRTTIDLEDRWFDQRWQAYGEENMILPGNDANDETRVRWKTKPIERRPLMVPTSTMQQGTLECWLDIMSPPVASSFPPDKVALPPTQIFEVRLVIWKAKDVPPQDWLEGMSDLFVKAWPEGCAQKETDTHWRAKKGKASWNYRLIYDVELGHSTRAMKFPYLYIQLWDRDILKWSDCAGEVVFNLGRYYRKAFKRGIAIKLFEDPGGAAASRTRRQQKVKKLEVIHTDEDIPPPEDGEVPTETEKGGLQRSDPVLPEGTTATTTDSITGADGKPTRNDSYFEGENPLTAAGGAKKAEPESLERDPEGGDGEDGTTVSARAVSSRRRQGSYIRSLDEIQAEEEASSKKKAERLSQEREVPWWWMGKVPHHSDSETDSDSEESDEDPNAPLLGKSAEEEEEDEEEEMKEQVNAFKNMTGVWDIDPPDSDWVHLTKKDHNTDKITPMGSLAISLQIWPKEKAAALPSGPARNEPNVNPMLPPPVGRLKWSWNPFVLGSELCGPKLCATFTCCLLAVAFILLMIFCQPFLNIIINLIFVVFGA